MSEQQISLSPDLQRLVNEGYEVQVRAGHLLITHVPYLTPRRQVSYGTLVSAVRWAGDVATPPATHVAYFAGEKPHRADGTPLKHIISEARRTLAPGIEVDVELSSKPVGGQYHDNYDKIVTYVALFEAAAHAVDETATARTFAPVTPAADDGVFNYWDTAPSSQDIVDAKRKLELGTIGIVGVGGTGSYVLDLLAKCPIREIHLFDGDAFFSHNAFRSPGAPSIDELRTLPRKASYFAGIYRHMHRGVIAHDVFIGSSNVELLKFLDVVFLCLDRGGDKKVIVEHLEDWGIPFIDVGMGIEAKKASVLGILRITTSTPQMRTHVHDKKRIPFVDGLGGNDYSYNIQIADLSALNATLAVIRWKKLCGFYYDLEREHFSAYTIDGNTLLNEDQA